MHSGKQKPFSYADERVATLFLNAHGNVVREIKDTRARWAGNGFCKCASLYNRRCRKTVAVVPHVVVCNTLMSRVEFRRAKRIEVAPVRVKIFCYTRAIARPYS